MRHPEQQDGEIFLGNLGVKAFIACGWGSKRRGIVALDANGDTIENPESFPVFIRKSDVQAQIALEKATHGPCASSDSRIAVYQKMLKER